MFGDRFLEQCWECASLRVFVSLRKLRMNILYILVDAYTDQLGTCVAREKREKILIFALVTEEGYDIFGANRPALK